MAIIKISMGSASAVLAPMDTQAMDAMMRVRGIVKLVIQATIRITMANASVVLVRMVSQVMIVTMTKGWTAILAMVITSFTATTAFATMCG